METYRAPKKAVHCWNYQQLSHIAENSNLSIKCVDCGNLHIPITCTRKIFQTRICFRISVVISASSAIFVHGMQKVSIK